MQRKLLSQITQTKVNCRQSYLSSWTSQIVPFPLSGIGMVLGRALLLFGGKNHNSCFHPRCISCIVCVFSHMLLFHHIWIHPLHSCQMFHTYKMLSYCGLHMHIAHVVINIAKKTSLLSLSWLFVSFFNWIQIVKNVTNKVQQQLVAVELFCNSAPWRDC